MATPDFKYAPMFQLGKDETNYYLLTKEGVTTSEFEGKTILKVAPEALTAMANQAFRDVNFLLRRSHNEQVASILNDPEASDNDKYVALTFLRNAEVACKGKLPFCRIRALPSYMAKRDSRCGQATATRRLSREVYITLIHRRTCDTRRMLH